MSLEAFYERYERSLQDLKKGNVLSHEEVKRYFKEKNQRTLSARRCAE